MSRECVIAVIDDDVSFRAALVELLNSLEYRTFGFASAEAFLGFDGSGVLDCVITDIHMPGMSGIELQQHIAAAGSDVPVIMITARSEPGLEARVIASGAICLLRKPFDADTLQASLSVALGGRESRP